MKTGERRKTCGQIETYPSSFRCDIPAQFFALHKPFGIQSWTIVVGGCED
jgi:hypothetical protein